MNSGQKTTRTRYWLAPFKLLLKLVGIMGIVAILSIFILVIVSDNIGSIGAMVWFVVLIFSVYVFTYFIKEIISSFPTIYHRFEGIANFDRSGYYPGATMVFSYTDRLAYRQPERPVAVTLKYAEFEMDGARYPIERDTIFTQTLKTTAYQLSTGLTIQIPAHSDQLNLSRSYPERLQRIWHVVVSDSVDGFSQTFSPGILPEPGVEV